MKHAALREAVLAANLALVAEGLVSGTFGNASGLDREAGVVAIKPSGVPYADMTEADIVVVDLAGARVAGTLNPSSDTATHLELYRAFPGIGGVVHTHSPAATAWAQARREIPCLGTTHADACRGPVPVTAPLTEAQVAGDYEAETGRVIAATFAGLDPTLTPMVLVAGHGPFTWGADAADAAHHAALLEQLADLAARTLAIDAAASTLEGYVAERHHLRKHGPGATYGQGA